MQSLGIAGLVLLVVGLVVTVSALVATCTTNPYASTTSGPPACNSTEEIAALGFILLTAGIALVLIGHRPARPCPSCGASLGRASSFCPKCGRPLPTVA